VSDMWATRIVEEGTEAPDNLLANPRNWRVHPKIQQDRLEALLDRVGWVQRVIVNRTTGHIVDGHLRVSLAARRGDPSVPVAYVEMTEDEEALVLATFDPIAELAGRDAEILADLIKDIEVDDSRIDEFLLELEGVDPNKVEKPGQTDPDDVPVPALTPCCQPGELWQLGDHRLYVGDSRAASSFRTLLQSPNEQEQPDAIWTDPPYNVAYTDSRGRTIQNDQMDTAAFVRFLRDLFTAAFSTLKPGSAVYVAHADSEGEAFRRAMRESGVEVRQCLIWIKDRFTIGRQDYQWQHEPVLYGWTEGTHRWYADRSQSTALDEGRDIDSLPKAELLDLVRGILEQIEPTVHREDKPSRSEAHPTMKPVRLIARHLKNSTKRGDLVLDPCAGSGSTLIACEQLGRRARVIELDPVYADVIIRRWQTFTDMQAERVDGAPWQDPNG